MGEVHRAEFLQKAWARMEKLACMGLCRSIGVSNFSALHFEQMLFRTREDMIRHAKADGEDVNDIGNENDSVLKVHPKRLDSMRARQMFRILPVVNQIEGHAFLQDLVDVEYQKVQELLQDFGRFAAPQYFVYCALMPLRRWLPTFEREVPLTPPPEKTAEELLMEQNEDDEDDEHEEKPPTSKRRRVVEIDPSEEIRGLLDEIAKAQSEQCTPAMVLYKWCFLRKPIAWNVVFTTKDAARLRDAWNVHRVVRLTDDMIATISQAGKAWDGHRKYFLRDFLQLDAVWWRDSRASGQVTGENLNVKKRFLAQNGVSEWDGA